MLDERWIERLEEMGIDEIEARSPITCLTRHGICSMCYGRDLARGHKVNMGEAVGVVAAQSIGEPGTQLTMRTFHIGGAASRATAQDNIQVKQDGTIRLHNLKFVTRTDKTLVAVSRSGELALADINGRERERYKLPYGSVIKVADHAAVNAGDIVVHLPPEPFYSHAGKRIILKRDKRETSKQSWLLLQITAVKEFFRDVADFIDITDNHRLDAGNDSYIPRLKNDAERVNGTVLKKVKS
jgi:hypothetical protein